MLLLDKTGTITLGNRQASEFLPLPGVTNRELAEAAIYASLADETPEGRSIVTLAAERFSLPLPSADSLTAVPFSANTRMSGADGERGSLRKGAADAVRRYVESLGQSYPDACDRLVREVAEQGGTPLVVTLDGRVLGVVYLKDIIKSGVREEFARLRQAGIRTVMITRDNPLTAAAIAAEAGVDDFLAEATPETKLQRIRELQEEGHLVAMTSDGVSRRLHRAVCPHGRAGATRPGGCRSAPPPHSPGGADGSAHRNRLR
ncbi:MAG: HAD-IC family P-type ATPase [Veillonellaceae bacterium]|nr:HAD-IC family P-type ATPase [Veillonellaceae bacterium]